MVLLTKSAFDAITHELRFSHYFAKRNNTITQKTINMKKPINYITLIAIVWLTALSSCKKDEPAVSTALSQDALQGTWLITKSEGTEWEKTKGIVTPKANDPSGLNATLKFKGTECTYTDTAGKFGSFGFTVDAANSTVTLTGVGLFNVKNYVAGKSMSMEQREPLDTDYESRPDGSGGSKLLYFQKFWTTTKQ